MAKPDKNITQKPLNYRIRQEYSALLKCRHSCGCGQDAEPYAAAGQARSLMHCVSPVGYNEWLTLF